MLILISASYSAEDETLKLQELFKSGLQTLHFRKPEADKKEYEKLLKAIAPENKRKTVLHQYHELAEKYNVKGLHLKEENRRKVGVEELMSLKKDMKIRNLTLSSSFHSTEEMIKYDGLFDYAFLSPVFESISKPGYVPDGNIQISGKMQKTKVIALGGIRTSNISAAKNYGFDGVGVLGAVWQKPELAEIRFREIKKAYDMNFNNLIVL